MKLQFKRAWWKECSVYQIYPASFCDSNDDGVGDIPGIISKLDYIESIGIDIIWLSPCFKSPQVDMGYDISDYKDVHEAYGTVEDLQTLIDEAHKRGMKLVLDLVVNHTSDQHYWFQQSRSSIHNEYRDWYIWKKPKYDDQGNRQPPNNWGGSFRGSAWEYDAATDEYYLHLFATEQPDLNWENPKVREAVHDVIRYWLEKGADGFRMDVINLISKDQDFPDGPIFYKGDDYAFGERCCCCGPRLHEYLKGIGELLIEYNAFSVGEMPGVEDPNQIIKAVDIDNHELAMIFQFEYVSLDIGPSGKYKAPWKWTIPEFKEKIDKWQNLLLKNNGWNSLYLENHDQPRSISRFASDLPQYRVQSGKLLANFLALQSGTPFVYEAQELGIINVPRDKWDIPQYRDLETINYYNEAMSKGATAEELAVIVGEFQKKSRDNARTPFPWSSAKNGGFSATTPWIDSNPDYVICNAEAAEKDPNSVLNHWRKVLPLRKSLLELFVYGDFEMVNDKSESVIAYIRTSVDEKQQALVLNNFSDKDVKYTIPRQFVSGEMKLCNYTRKEVGGEVILQPYESFVLITN